MTGYIRNIVLSTPEGKWLGDRWEGGPRALAEFYAELLGMQIIREDWPKVAKDADSAPQLAFGDGPTETYRPPAWPDPERPQQLHVDFPVSDLDAAEQVAVDLGAARLQDKGDHRSYADPAGHPFCLYLDADERSEDGRPLSGRIGRVVIDCFSPRALASFYEELLDMRTRVEDTAERVLIAGADNGAPMLAFQHARFEAPRWPDPAYPQQVHLDLYFDDGPAAIDLAERLGAVRLPAMGGSCPVYADPAAHPFCLCVAGQ